MPYFILPILRWDSLSIEERQAALARPSQESPAALQATVATILADVRSDGDCAVQRYSRQFDGAALSQPLQVPQGDFARAWHELAEQEGHVQEALLMAQANIKSFHDLQRPQEFSHEPIAGLVLKKRWRPLSSVGLYIPGGICPLLSSVLMLAIPATIAGCSRIVMVSPPDSQGRINRYILAAAHIAGVTEAFAIGGAQAIGALAYGTASVPRVDKIFGPGNRFVTEAKQQVARDVVAIDMPAGPSEVMVLADGKANPDFVAWDLLSQAEHGPDSQAVLVTDDASFADTVRRRLSDLVGQISNAHIARESLRQSRALVVPCWDTAVEVANRYGPEHLIIQTHADNDAIERQITCAGSIFVGSYTPESLGDYASGTNHVLPTGGWARSRGGLTVSDFMVSSTSQSASPAALGALRGTIATLARLEGLDAHRRAVEVRGVGGGS